MPSRFRRTRLLLPTNAGYELLRFLKRWKILNEQQYSLLTNIDVHAGHAKQVPLISYRDSY